MASPYIRSGERMLKRGEAARILGVTPATVTVWDRAGKLESVRNPGNARLFSESDVRNLAAARETAAPPAERDAPRGFFAIGIYHPRHEVNTGSLWRSASLYGAALIFTVGRRYKAQASDTTDAPGRIPLMHFADMADLVAHLPHSCPLAGVEMDSRSVPLARFTHPPRAAYLLGAEDHGLPAAIADRCHVLVQVEAPAAEPLNVACCGTVLMHDRYVREAGRG